MKWSKYQKAIFKEVSEGSGNLVVEACAGSGKSTTLVEALKYIPPHDSWLLCAFNKRIAAELKKRAPETGDIRTLHSLGLRAIKQRWPNIELDTNKIWSILDKTIGKDKKYNGIKAQLKKAVSLCKGSLINEHEDIDSLLDNYDIDVIDYDRDQFIKTVNQTLLASYEDTDTIDFDDMIWFPYMFDLDPGSYNYILIDECQDLNPAQIELALTACEKDGRVIVFGDHFQAIYGWRGAPIDTMAKLVKRLDAKSLPLSISYRCPTKVVKKAKQFVDKIEAAPNAAEGIVEYISSKEMLKKAKPGCFILSRVNAPLIGLALGFVKQNIPCNIQGRDIGANLTNLIKKSRRKTVPAFLNWLDKWQKKESKRLRNKGRSTVSITDKAECLKALANDCNTVAEMKSKLHDLFDDEDDTNRIILSTVHRSKGLERDVVFILNGTFFGSGQEEDNIKYVACTRSAGELYYVTGGNYSKFKNKS